MFKILKICVNLRPELKGPISFRHFLQVHFPAQRLAHSGLLNLIEPLAKVLFLWFDKLTTNGKTK